MQKKRFLQIFRFQEALKFCQLARFDVIAAGVIGESSTLNLFVIGSYGFVYLAADLSVAL